MVEEGGFYIRFSLQPCDDRIKPLHTITIQKFFGCRLLYIHSCNYASDLPTLIGKFAGRQPSFPSKNMYRLINGCPIPRAGGTGSYRHLSPFPKSSERQHLIGYQAQLVSQPP